MAWSMSDPTLHRQDGKLWLFGTVSEARARANDELHIYIADALDGVWWAPPGNPVVSDRAGPGRRAGCFSGTAHLIRPGQDCSGRYGRAVVLNRVDALNERAYAETPIGRIDSSGLPGNRGYAHGQLRRWPRIPGRTHEGAWKSGTQRRTNKASKPGGGRLGLEDTQEGRVKKET